MARSKTDFTAVKKPKDRKSFGAAYKQSEVEVSEGKHRACIRSIEERPKCFEVTGMIFSLDGKSNFGYAKGFLPLCYDDGDIMEQFLETFDNPEFFDEVIGKEAIVDIVINETAHGVFPNIVSFEKYSK